MITPDPSQQSVLALEATRHARVLGAPGSGKTTALVEAYARALDRPGWSEADVLALAPSRLAAAALRGRIEARVQRALGGTPVRTAASLAFAVLGRVAAVAGDPAPRLLTGTVQDEAIAAVIEDRIGSGAGGYGALVPDVLRSPVFRAELREFWRVLDDFDLDPAAFLARLEGLRGRSAGEMLTDAPDDELLERWVEALGIITAVDARLRTVRPGEVSSSALLRRAALELRSGNAAAPRLLLVDDAQELDEGQLALIAACAAAGSAVWVFGDPDVATETFRGERSRAIADLAGELARRGAVADAEQLAVLGTVHRHGERMREFVRSLTGRIGAAGAGGQRAALAAGRADEDAGADTVRFVLAESLSEQLGVIAHRLRAAHLGLDGAPSLEWSRMAVLCRSRDEATRISRGLAARQVPTGVAAGGIVLREHRVVRDLLRLLQHALGITPLGSDHRDGRDVQHLLSGPIGGLDPVAVRRLRGALMMHERREARDEGREPRSTDELVLDAFLFPGAEPAVDSAGGRSLRRLGRIAAAGSKEQLAGGTPREVLWALWSATRLAEKWQEEALAGRGVRAEEADRSLDAVMGLFFALQRHEEQASDQPIGELLDELLQSAVPEDTLAQSGERDAVTVTTPQGAQGREFDLVAVIGAQDGVWPNTRARGSLLGTIALERWLRGGEATEASRRDTIHDELRLFTQACSRARSELLVVSISDEDHHPSAFFGFGRKHLCEGLPSARLTLRGATGEMRRRIIADSSDRRALASLAAIAMVEGPGAHPDEWYGVLPPSTADPLVDLSDPEAIVRVSPSQFEKAEQCPLDWAVSALGGGSGSLQMSLGTLVHHAFETAQSADPDAILEEITREWSKLPFDAEWESERGRDLAEVMAKGLAAYLGEFEASDRELLGRELEFKLRLGKAELRGTADRLEARESAAGTEVTVVDLKTGTTPPTGPKTQENAQLQAYQLGVARGAFEADPDLSAERTPEPRSGGARLLYVHPEAAKGTGFVERAQQPLDDGARAAFEQRVAAIAEVMAAGSFTARVDHHCADPYAHGDCRIHIIQAVSHS